jgi:hypothetical protein
VSEQARQSVEMRDFPGLDLVSDPRDVEAGAAREQTNLVCWSGSLRVRPAPLPVSFDETIDVSP